MVPLHSDLALVCCSEETLALTPTLSPTRGGRTQSALEFSCAPVRRRLIGIYVGCSIFNGLQAPVCAFLFALVGLVGGRLSAGDTNSVLSAWLSSQTNLQTWSATVIQTLPLTSLSLPLSATAHFLYALSHRF